MLENKVVEYLIGLSAYSTFLFSFVRFLSFSVKKSLNSVNWSEVFPPQNQYLIV